MSSSPFPYDKLSVGDSFIARDKDLAKLQASVEAGTNLLIYSKRRMGKSSLIKQFFQSQTSTICIYADVYDVTKKEDFARLLLKSLSNVKLNKSVLKNLADLFKRLRFEMTIDPKNDKYGIRPTLSSLTFDEMMQDFFAAIQGLSEKQPVVIAIDDFQQIAHIKDTHLDAYLRKFIQERNTNVSFIFAGSKRHLLTSLFAYKAPLFEMANHYALTPLAFEDIRAYVSQHLNISDDDLSYLCTDIADNETKMMQHLLHLLYVGKEKTPIRREMIDQALDEILNEKEATFRLLFDGLNTNQRIAMKAVVNAGHKLYSEAVLQQFGITKSALQSAIRQLFARELIDKENDRYFIPDRSLELWLARMMAS